MDIVLHIWEYIVLCWEYMGRWSLTLIVKIPTNNIPSIDRDIINNSFTMCQNSSWFSYQRKHLQPLKSETTVKNNNFLFTFTCWKGLIFHWFCYQIITRTLFFQNIFMSLFVMYLFRERVFNKCVLVVVWYVFRHPNCTVCTLLS